VRGDAAIPTLSRCRTENPAPDNTVPSNRLHRARLNYAIGTDVNTIELASYH
jgi:hypothetical protein